MLKVLVSRPGDLQLSLNAEAPGACFVRWGDGPEEVMTVSQAPTDSTPGTYTKGHTYAVAGRYEVEVRSSDIRWSQVFTIGAAALPGSKFSGYLGKQEQIAEELAGTVAVKSNIG
jgi:hypothetical protein